MIGAPATHMANMTPVAKISAADIVADARWFPHRLDMERRTVSFGRFDRDALARASFLDYRIEDAAQGWAVLSFDDLLGVADKIPPAAPTFLFHTSYCCSTLLARALDHPGRVLALKEPEIIMGVSNAYRMAQSQQELDAIHKLRAALLSLIARPHQGDERVLIKPTNAANNLVALFAALKLPMILLYGDLRGFLASVIKKGDPSKTIIRQIYRVYAMDRIGVSAIAQRDALALTDLQIAALVWRHQMEFFEEVLRAPENGNARSLDFRALLKSPAETLHAAGAHLGFDIARDDAQVVATGPLFSTDAKDSSRSYDAQTREAEERALLDEHVDALDLIENWAFNLSLWPTRTESLSRPLLG